MSGNTKTPLQLADRDLDAAFGNVLRELRLHRGMSQEELAFETCVHRTFISQLERGLKTPSVSTLFKLARALCIQPSEIIVLLEARTK